MGECGNGLEGKLLIDEVSCQNIMVLSDPEMFEKE